MALSALFLSSCVSTKLHKELQARYKELQSENTNLRAENDSLQSELGRVSSELQSLQKQMAQNENGHHCFRQRLS